MTGWETAVAVVVGAAVGGVAGLAFFGGLWWTSRRLVTAKRPALLVAGSLLARLLLVGAVLVLLARVEPVLLAGAVAGLLGARVAITRTALADRSSLPSRPTGGRS